jgi:hypothetical protein
MRGECVINREMPHRKLETEMRDWGKFWNLWEFMESPQEMVMPRRESELNGVNSGRDDGFQNETEEDRRRMRNQFSDRAKEEP